MRWIKRGKIFDPSRYRLFAGCDSYAQAPQALEFDDFIRIYFSTRVRDCYGQYLSHIAFVDMDKSLNCVIGVSKQAVIALGELGCFDQHGIFPMSILRVGELIYGYTCGWNRRVSVSVDTAIGLAISEDKGSTFRRLGDGPILAATPEEPFLVGDGIVKVIDNVFHMWYIFGTEWKQYAKDIAPDRTYKIGHAVSNDGKTWSRDGGRQIIPDRIGPAESQALPTVIKIGCRYHMFFCYRESFDFRRGLGRGYRIGHAWSINLNTWTRDDDLPLLEGTPNSWDSDMQCYPHAFQSNGKIYLLYNGNEFGRYGFGVAELEI
jgi:hypothetical protein